MPTRAFVFSFLALIPTAVLARDSAPATANHNPISAQIYSHGTIRQTRHALEAVVAVSGDLMQNIRPGQRVSMDVRQGQLRGTVTAVRSALEITIALDASRPKFKLQPGQAVIAVIELEADSACENPIPPC